MSTRFAPFTKQNKTRKSNHLIAIDIFLPQLTFHKFFLCVNIIKWACVGSSSSSLSSSILFLLLIYQQTSDDSDRLNETINYRKWHRDVCFLINLLFSSSLMVTLHSKKPTCLYACVASNRDERTRFLFLND